MKNQYVTITEFAKMAGISRNTVYRNLSTKLSHFVTERDNKKMLNIQALELFNCQPTVNQGDSFVNHENDENIVKNIELMERTISIMERQLDEKDKQIAELTERNHEVNVLLGQQTKLIETAAAAPAPQQPEEDSTIIDDLRIENRSLRNEAVDMKHDVVNLNFKNQELQKQIWEDQKTIDDLKKTIQEYEDQGLLQRIFRR